MGGLQKNLNCVLFWHSFYKIHTYVIYAAFTWKFQTHRVPFLPKPGKVRWVGGQNGGCHAMLDVWTVLPSRVLCGTRHNLNPKTPLCCWVESSYLRLPGSFSTPRLSPHGERRPPRHHQSLLAAVQLLRYITHRWRRGRQKKRNFNSPLLTKFLSPHTFVIIKLILCI